MFGFWGLGIGVLGLGCRVQHLRFSVWGLEVGAWGLG